MTKTLTFNAVVISINDLTGRWLIAKYWYLDCSASILEAIKNKLILILIVLVTIDHSLPTSGNKPIII